MGGEKGGSDISGNSFVNQQNQLREEHRELGESFDLGI
jgi:hypothetical protein